ncbi:MULTISPECIES: ABC transporter ATP-binding protein [Arthrobacter]|uniref:ABC transporter ATP-binding protein n=1 Tax=Arthrobacter terricola TaxID=2547396 RepID=A0A4R5K9S1_9MICC|nr:MULTISPECIES: ABC transporter ATP-binding protein [Arthrobacter]MBT8163026.1 ABC transporter ATP-binding protein [Arthrobacter sp. GN70]TDF91769.1 ABC transporter ATP-binding protein [Arthrobacter terricola]
MTTENHVRRPAQGEPRTFAKGEASPAVWAQHLGKTYGAASAVADVSFAVDPGTIVALLGPNGAGKTTTIEMLEGHRTPSTGRAQVLGLDPSNPREFRKLRRRIGVALQVSGFESALTVRDVARRQRSYYTKGWAIEPIAEALSLTDKLDKKLGSLSVGTRHRADILFALVGAPEVVFLDEPTAGLDPVSRREALSLLRSLRDAGVTVVLTSHQLDEIQEVADTIHVLRAGEIVFSGAPQALVDVSGVKTVATFSVASDVRTLPEGAQRAGNRIEVSADDSEALIQTLRIWSEAEQVPLAGLSIHEPNLDDAYVELIGGTV